MITKDILVDGAEYKLTLTDQVLNQVDNLKALYATAAEDPESFEQVSSEISAAINNISESISPEISDGHLDGLIQEVFKAVEDKKSPRLMLFMPPRHGKSTLASICFPAWHLGKTRSMSS